jgi:hypothetical protein
LKWVGRISIMAKSLPIPPRPDPAAAAERVDPLGKSVAGAEASIGQTVNSRLTRLDRLGRIGEILYRAACRTQAVQGKPASPMPPGLTKTQQEILSAITGLESAAPEQLLGLVGMSRATVARGLQVLLTRGLVVRSGQTRRVRYLLPLKQKVTPLHERDLSNQPARTLPVSRFRQISGERSSELEL